MSNKTAENLQNLKQTLDQLASKLDSASFMQEDGSLFSKICVGLDNSITKKKYQFIENCDIPDIPDAIDPINFDPVVVQATTKPDIPIQLLANLLPCALPDRSPCPEIVLNSNVISSSNTVTIHSVNTEIPCELVEPQIDVELKTMFDKIRLKDMLVAETCCCDCACDTDTVDVCRVISIEHECDDENAPEITVVETNPKIVSLPPYTITLKDNISVEYAWCERYIDIKPDIQFDVECTDPIELEAYTTGTRQSYLRHRCITEDEMLPAHFIAYNLYWEFEFQLTDVSIDICDGKFLHTPKFKVFPGCIEYDESGNIERICPVSDSDRMTPLQVIQFAEDLDNENLSEKKKKRKGIIEILGHKVAIGLENDFNADLCAGVIETRPVITADTEPCDNVTVETRYNSNSIELGCVQLTINTEIETTTDWCAGTTVSKPTVTLSAEPTYCGGGGGGGGGTCSPEFKQYEPIRFEASAYGTCGGGCTMDYVYIEKDYTYNLLNGFCTSTGIEKRIPLSFPSFPGVVPVSCVITSTSEGDEMEEMEDGSFSFTGDTSSTQSTTDVGDAPIDPNVPVDPGNTEGSVISDDCPCNSRYLHIQFPEIIIECGKICPTGSYYQSEGCDISLTQETDITQAGPVRIEDRFNTEHPENWDPGNGPVRSKYLVVPHRKAKIVCDEWCFPDGTEWIEESYKLPVVEGKFDVLGDPTLIPTGDVSCGVRSYNMTIPKKEIKIEGSTITETEKDSTESVVLTFDNRTFGYNGPVSVISNISLSGNTLTLYRQELVYLNGLLCSVRNEDNAITLEIPTCCNSSSSTTEPEQSASSSSSTECPLRHILCDHWNELNGCTNVDENGHITCPYML